MDPSAIATAGRGRGRGCGSGSGGAAPASLRGDDGSGRPVQRVGSPTTIE